MSEQSTRSRSIRNQSTRRGMRGLMIGAFALVIGIASYQVYAHGLATEKPRSETNFVGAAAPAFQVGVDKPAPPLELKDVNGKTVKLSEFRGKVIVLNFWATWCPPCRKEIPGFIELQKQYGEKGVQFVGVALDEEGLSKVKPYLEKNPINYPILIGDAKGVVRYGEMGAIPVTYVIDKKGIIRQSYVGMRMKSVIESAITPLMAE